MAHAKAGNGRRAAATVLLAATVAAAAIVLMPAGRHAVAAEQSCRAPDALASLSRPMPHVARRVARGGPLTIVALGSSSTWGTGASSPKHSYPSRLAAILTKRFPHMKVRVLNRGVGGEEAPAMAARLDSDVLAVSPDLVIWQVGTNAVLHNDAAGQIGAVVSAGVARMHRLGIDVMLMNLQYAPAVLRHPRYRAMLHALDVVSYEEDAPLFPRFAMMRGWAEEGLMPLSLMLAPDHLHMTDASYDCLARQVAASIADAAPAAGVVAVKD
jgi:lysophospholipase L1-like esterase